jgi:all-trans-8'-apo-beta-carotenal 15,15'-oxygenase
VATPEYAAERSAQRVLYRNTFGTQRAGGPGANALDVRQKNVANTSVLLWAGRLWALWEARLCPSTAPILALYISLSRSLSLPRCRTSSDTQALQPYRLDPATLATRGVDTLEGLLREGLPFASGFEPLDALLRAGGTGLGGDAFSAHPHVCGGSGNLVTFSYQIRVNPAAPPEGPLQTVLTVMELPPGGLTPVTTRQVPLQGYGFVHDFCFTARWYIFFQNPVDLDIVPFVAGARTPGQCLSFRAARPTLVHLVPRGAARSSAPIVIATLPACFVFHHANAYDDEETGDIVIDSVHMPGLDLDIQGDFRDADFEASPRYSLWRTRISGAGSVSSAPVVARTAELSGRVVEFPCVAPARFGRRARWAYAAVGTHPRRIQPLQGWVKFDTDAAHTMTNDATGASDTPHTTWALAAAFFLGEPQFVARAGATSEDDGWLVGWVFDSERDVSAFAVVDARSMTTVALARLRHHIPYGLHGSWTPEYFGPAGAA